MKDLRRYTFSGRRMQMPDRTLFGAPVQVVWYGMDSETPSFPNSRSIEVYYLSYGYIGNKYQAFQEGLQEKVLKSWC